MHVSYAVCTRCVWLECTSLSLCLCICVGLEQDLKRFPWLRPSSELLAKIQAHQIAGHTQTAEDYEQQLLNTKTHIDAVQTWISELEDSVAEATAFTILHVLTDRPKHSGGEAFHRYARCLTQIVVEPPDQHG